MGLPGRLQKSDFGFSMPVDAPLYTPFPVHYRGCTLFIFTYVTDGDQAAELLPAGCELTDVPIAQLVFAKYPFSTVGTYNEVSQTLLCRYRGQVYTYAVRLHVDNPAAMSAGREIGGFPKKMGIIEFHSSHVETVNLMIPPNMGVCSAVIDPLQPNDFLNQTQVPQPPIPFVMDFLSLRVIPNPEHPETPSLSQLIGTKWTLYGGEFFSARGSVRFLDTAEINPYQQLPVVRPLENPQYKPNPGDRDEERSQSRLTRNDTADLPGFVLPPHLIYRGDMKVTEVKILQDL